MTDPYVLLEGVTKTYQLGDGSVLKAADEVSLELPAGGLTALIGASGSGKSTLLNLIGAVERPDKGTITVGGQQLTSCTRRQLADYRSGIGFVFQQFHLLAALSVLDNVLAPLSGRAFDGDRVLHARELLAAVGLEEREDALPSQLSGGQQQRAAIARALLNKPSLLLADEPTGNLDSRVGAEIISLIAELPARLGTTVIIATHDPTVAAICDTLVHIVDGKARLVTEHEESFELRPRRAELGT